jgi:hypothetical protein
MYQHIIFIHTDINQIMEQVAAYLVRLNAHSVPGTNRHVVHGINPAFVEEGGAIMTQHFVTVFYSHESAIVAQEDEDAPSA